MKFRFPITIVLSFAFLASAVFVYTLNINRKINRNPRTVFTFLATGRLSKEIKQEISTLLASKSMQFSRTSCSEYGLTECDDYYFSNDILGRVYDNETTGNYRVILDVKDEQSTAQWREDLRNAFNAILTKHEKANIPRL